MNQKSFRELWKRGTDKLSDIFGARQTLKRRIGGRQSRAGYVSVISATTLDENPADRIAGFVAKILEEDKTAIQLSVAGAVLADASRASNFIKIDVAGTRALAYSRISAALSHRQINRIVAIPQSTEDLLNAIAASDISAAPLVLWFTEGFDFHHELSKPGLLDEAMRKARLCFAGSELLRAEIQKQYGRKVWIIPSSNSAGQIEQAQPSKVFSSDLFQGFSEWISQSLAAGAPIDDRFEKHFLGVRDRLAPYVDPPAPADIHWEMAPHYQALDRLRASGYKPEFVVDVGASTGYWSHISTKIFPSCRYILIEPLLEQYLAAEGTIYRLHPEFVKIKAAAGNIESELELNVSPDLYGSSFFDSSASAGRSIQVRVRTLDEIAVSEAILGRGMLKIDVQFSEHLVLDGGRAFLQQVDVIFIEVSLRRFVPAGKTFFEIVDQLHGLGFEYRDYAGAWRDPATGELLQQDAVFARQPT
jgi:FkbM family methyltransferase